MSQILSAFRIDKDADLLRARQIITTVAEALQFGKFAKTRTVTAVLELARNALFYAGGGRLRLSLVKHNGFVAFRVSINDHGPGIDDIDAVLHGQNGEGRGLRGVRNIADRLEFQSGPEGTRVTVTFASDVPASLMAVSADRVKQAVSALAKLDPAAELAQQNRELLDAIATRDMLMQEVHHRTANNLALISSLVKISANKSESDETAQALGDLDARIQAVIGAHQMMQQKPGQENVSLKDFLRRIAVNAENAFKAQDRRISVAVDGDDAQVEGKLAIDLGLVVNELIMNAFKHAFADRQEGHVDVGFSLTEDGPIIRVEDDGTGLPQTEERPRSSGSLGWQLIRKLTQQYGGTIEIDSTRGFSVAIFFDDSILA